MSYGTSSGTLPIINDGQVGFTTQVNITQEITIPIRSAFTTNTIAEITLNPGVYIITGQVSGQPTGAPPGGGNMYYNIFFSETNNVASSNKEGRTDGYPVKACTNFFLSFGNINHYFRDTITHTVTVATRKTLYFHISIISVSDLKIVSGNVISATRIA